MYGVHIFREFVLAGFPGLITTHKNPILNLSMDHRQGSSYTFRFPGIHHILL